MRSNLHRTFALLSLGASLLGAANLMAEEKVLAFPGAEGFGRYTTGGRGGNVYHVTNLKDNTAKGSLRWALSQPGPRTIVFDVSGTIHLSSAITITDNTTLAGQTAPGDGICLADYPVYVGSNTIIRYTRFRLGNKNVKANGADGWDGLGGNDGHDIIIDHCSVSWSIDEACSIYGNVNSTVQWTIISQSLVNAGHSKGNHGYGGIVGGSGASFHHNLLVHHSSRTPRLGARPTTQTDERVDMRNCVMYNYGGNGCYGGEGMNVNIVNNYYKPGPATPTGDKGRRIAGVGIRTKSYCTTYPAYSPMLDVWGTYFVEGNVNTKYADVTKDNWNYGMYNQIDKSASATDGTWNDQVKKDIRLAEPIDFVYTTTHTAEEAYEKVLDYAGASLHRDSHDALMVSDVREGVATYTGKGNSKGFINSQDDNKPSDAPNGWSAWPTLNSLEAPLDTDGDGMPDDWETSNGLDPNNAADRNTLTEEGYTMLEVYMASLVEHITEAQNEGGVVMGGIYEYDPVQEFYEISKLTREGNAWAFGNGVSISNSVGGGYTTSGEYIGMGRDQQHLITLPAGAKINWIRIQGRARYDMDNFSDASLVELNGKTFDEGTYVLPKGSEEVTIDVPIESGAKNNLTMTWTGNNPWCKIFLYTTDNGLTSVEEISQANASSDDAWYNMQGIRVNGEKLPGLYIHNGKKIIIK